MKVYAYVDMTRANADGTFPVYVIVKNSQGRFFVNTGMTTCDRLVGSHVFPKKDRHGSHKTTLLGKYLADVESICLQREITGFDNKSLKASIKEEVFGFTKARQKTLADHIADFASTKLESTASLYRITERKVRSFDSQATLDGITPEWLEGYRLWCIDGKMKINGAAKELRNIRAVFNYCRKNGRTTNYPFSFYSIVEEETCPNDLSSEEIRRLRDYPCEEWQKPYVDFFMLSFYLAGINPGDLLTMKSESHRNGYLTFVRRKTNKQGAKKIRSIVIPVVDEARRIIERYPSREGFLIGFMDGRKDYHSFIRCCNDALKKVGESEVVPDKLGKMRKIEYHPLFPDITLYTARYSFGSIAANELDISEQTIGQCLGHSWSKHVTARYISHDQRKIDDAINKVVDLISR